jgi:hypothetical protein
MESAAALYCIVVGVLMATWCADDRGSVPGTAVAAHTARWLSTLRGSSSIGMFAVLVALTLVALLAEPSSRRPS